MGLERNTTINEHDNAERTRLLQENQAKEELYKKHGQELDAKRDISAPPESESANLSGVDCSDKSAKDKLDKNNQIKDDESIKSKETKETELWEKNNSICAKYYDNASANIEKDSYGNDYKPFTQKEKELLSSELKENINSVSKGERGNYRVPEPKKIKGVSCNAEGNVRIKEAWIDGTDGAKEGTRRMEIVKAKDESGNPTYIDRIGSENGNYFSPMKEDGTPYSLRERAIGDYLPEKNIEDNDSYHKYKVKEDFTRKNFEKAIDRTYADEDVKQDKIDQLISYYSDAKSSIKTDGHDGETYKFNGDNIDGVKSGDIDNMFGTKDNPDGGGKQYITPFNGKELLDMGMIEEVKKEDY